MLVFLEDLFCFWLLETLIGLEFVFFLPDFVHCLHTTVACNLTYSGTHPMTSPVCFTAEFNALKEECSSLRKRIQAIEAEMKM